MNNRVIYWYRRSRFTALLYVRCPGITSRVQSVAAKKMEEGQSVCYFACSRKEFNVEKTEFNNRTTHRLVWCRMSTYGLGRLGLQSAKM